MKLRLLFLLMILLGFRAEAQTVTNITHPGAGPYASLQAALDNAATVAGDVLTMTAGSFYNESATVRKSVSLSLGAGISIRSLNISDSCSLTLLGSLAVTDTLKFTNGFVRIPTPTDMISLGAAATVNRINGHVQGMMQKAIGATGPYILMKFEVGDQTSYTPVELNLYNVTAIGTVQVSTQTGDHASIALSGINPSQSVNRRYAVRNTGVVFDNFTAKLSFATNDLDPGADYRMFRVAALGGVIWTQPVIALVYPNEITATGMPQFNGLVEFIVGEQVPPALVYPANGATGIFPTCQARWSTAIGAASYQFQLFLDTTKAPLKDLANILPTSYDIIYPSIKLGYDTVYYWRVKAQYGNLSSDWSPMWSFRIGTPDSLIDNAIVHIHFRHQEGSIDSLRFKPGSNRELLYQPLNTSTKGGLNRVNSEVGSKCTAWIVDTTPGVDTASFLYVNSSYGTKRVWMRWSANLGFEMKNYYSFSAASKFAPGVYWRPGGDLGPQYDYITVIDTSGKKLTRYSSYPGKDSVLYNGLSRGSGITDTRFDETFGFKNKPTDSLYAATGTALNGPYSRTTRRDTSVQEFAIKSTSAYWAWVDNMVEPFFNITPTGGGVTWFSGTPQSVVWQSTPLFGAGVLVNIKLSTDGGLTFPITVASGIPNSGTYVIPSVPVVSSTNCRMRVELASNPGYFGMSLSNFIIRASNAVVFTVPSSLTTAPGESFVLPFYINPNGRNIYAFDSRITFNKALLSMGKFRLGSNLPNGWKINVNDSSARGFVQIGGECRVDSLNFPIQLADTVLVFTFNVKTTARVGWGDTLKIDNTHLSAAGPLAETYPVSGNDCPLAFHAALAGKLTYYSNKKSLAGDSVVLSYKGFGNGMTLLIDTIAVTDSLGKFDFSPIPPSAQVSLSVRRWASEVTAATDSSVITSGDALLAFMGRDGGPTVVTGYQKIAIDVNGDGRANSTDAFAILKRATGTLPNFRGLAPGGRGDWVFVDSAYKMTSYNWTSAAQTRSVFPLDSSRAKENFYGILLGDVLASYGVTVKKLNKVGEIDDVLAAGPAQFSVPRVINGSIGDTVQVPVVLNANRNPLGSFDVTVRYNKNMLKYTGRYVRNAKLAGMEGWDMDVYGSNAEGRVSIGAADFEQDIRPVMGSGAVVTLKFIVLGSDKWIDSCDILLTNVGATDTVASFVAVSAVNGKVLTSGKAGVPATFALLQNYPNPFNPSTHISFGLPSQARASVTIYNILGQSVRSFAPADLSAGYHEVIWDGRDNDNRMVSSGVYFYRLSAEGEGGTKFNEVKRMMLVK
ncbi:MAG TPA: cohesin domain-containing protein [Bacteroidota bacterium]|nr:cohesin domain-containing protein [Bacteroidota bacterium]